MQCYLGVSETAYAPLSAWNYNTFLVDPESYSEYDNPTLVTWGMGRAGWQKAKIVFSIIRMKIQIVSYICVCVQ